MSAIALCSIKNGLVEFFSKRECWFLTLRGGKFNSIGKVSDHLRKISKNYFVIKELDANKASNHFHAIFEHKGPVRKSWFRKGVHMNVFKVGKPDLGVGKVIPPNYKFNELEISEIANKVSYELAESIVIDQGISNYLPLAKRSAYAKRKTGYVINYMFKSIELIRYNTYIFCKHGKSIDVQVAPPPPVGRRAVSGANSEPSDPTGGLDTL